jgi:hypothetical protein
VWLALNDAVEMRTISVNCRSTSKVEVERVQVWTGQRLAVKYFVQVPNWSMWSLLLMIPSDVCPKIESTHMGQFQEYSTYLKVKADTWPHKRQPAVYLNLNLYTRSNRRGRSTKVFVP